MGQGGLVQLVAYGNQDLFLTSNPSITFFKAAMRRYTAFAAESIQLLPSSASDFGRKSVFTISRNGDLAAATWVQFDLPALTPVGTQTIAYTRFLGHVLLEEVTISIGGSQLDKHVSEWYQIIYELQMPASKEDGYNYLIGNRDTLIRTPVSTPLPEATIWVPLQFWYCRSAGLALPLISLQFHETRIEISVRKLEECVVRSTSDVPTKTTALNITIWQDYLYLDVSERSSVASEAQEQVIDLLSFTGKETVTGNTYKTRLAFNHPSKYFAFVIRPSANTLPTVNRWMDFSDPASAAENYAGKSPLKNAILLLNGNERFARRTSEYFSMIQPLQRFTKCSAKGTVYVYSFSLFPETSQPSGTLNCSRIDSISWSFEMSGDTNSTYEIFTFSNHINILRIKSGMAGLAFSS